MFYDAHSHYQFPEILAMEPALWDDLQSIKLSGAAVNATRPDDWEDVLRLAHEHPGMVPCLGLHPWNVNDAVPGLLDQLRRALQTDPNVMVGEIGLDCWVVGHDLSKQLPLFKAQLDLAHEFDRSATIHCLRAWEPLLEVLAEHPIGGERLLIHACNAPAAIFEVLLERGVVFSFSGAFLAPKKRWLAAIYAKLPAERLLVETDSPSMAAPQEFRTHSAAAALNHPANIAANHRHLAALRDEPLETLAASAGENFRRLFYRQTDEICPKGLRLLGESVGVFSRDSPAQEPLPRGRGN